MNDHVFTEEDKNEALKTSGTGMWRLESAVGEHVRFYGDSYMNYLLGVSDDLSPEERFDTFMGRIYPEDAALFQSYYNTLKDTAQAEVVYRYMHPEFGVIYVRCGGRKSFNQGNMICYRGFHQNVTNTVRVEQETRNRLTEQAELYRDVAFRMMENYSDAAAKINLETGEFGWYTFDGKGEKNVSEYEDIYQTVSGLVPEEYKEEFQTNASLENLRKRLADQETYSFSTFVRRKEDGELRRLTYWYYRMDREQKLVLSVYKDTTDDYELERQLAEALLSAKRANKAKTIFLNNMSHDMRTPMNAIIGFTELALKNLGDVERCKDYLGKINTSSAHLLSLINNVLDMSRIESGRMILAEEKYSLSMIGENVTPILLAEAEKKGTHFSVVCTNLRDETVLCDKLRLNQVILNCASNAIKFTPAGGEVSVTVQQVESAYPVEGYGEYQFIIQDNGIGMEEEFLEHLFDPFSREENSVHQIEGTGLGMAICKNVVDLMKGDIQVKSKKGEGTRITITLRLPIAREGQETSTDNFTAAKSLVGKRILLVEDNALNREIAVELLKETGADLETAEDGQEAVNKMAEAEVGYYDLILMDIQMPLLNGYEATKAIRQMERPDAKDVRIIAMTANAFEEDRQRAFAAGMNGHLSKPIDIAEMMRLLEKNLQG